jgi:hypothetical protein
MDRGQSKELASREGGSGLHKIRKLLDNYGLLRRLEFGFGSDANFYIEIEIEKEMRP